MEIWNKVRPLLPHAIAIVLFAALSFAFFYPVLEGKVLQGNDYMVSKYTSREINDYRQKTGKEPLWTDAIFSGMPAYLISARYPGNLIKNADNIIRVFKMPVSVIFVAMAGFYIILLMFGMNPWLSIIGSLAYGLSSFTFQILAVGHNTQAIAIAYMAPVIGSIWYAYRREAVRGAVMLGFFLSLEILANHPQITYYSFMCLLVFLIIELIYAIRDKVILKFIRTSAILIVPMILALGTNFASLYCVNEYGKYSTRGKSDLTISGKSAAKGLDPGYITAWSYGVDESFNLLVPDYKGGATRPFDRNSETFKALRQNNNTQAAGMLSEYWGTQPLTDGPHYVGAIIFFLFILGLIIVRGPVKWWLLIATILSLMLSWGKNFMPLTTLFINIFPGYDKFRSVTMILVISQFCIPLLGVLTLKEIFSGEVSQKEFMKGLKISGIATLGFLLLTLAVPGIAGSFLSPHETDYPAWLKTAMIADRKELLRGDSFRSMLFIVLGASALTAFVSGKLRKEYSLLIIGSLILIDLWTVDKRYLGADRFGRQPAIKPSVADQMILKDNSNYRVLNISVSPFNDNSPTAYFHKSIGGYHGAKMERYQELIDSCIYPALGRFETAAANSKSIEDYQNVLNNNPIPVIDMLNGKYIILNAGAPPLLNTHALGSAWFIEKPVFADNANMELATLNRIDPSKEAVIDKSFSKLVPESVYPVTDGDKIDLDSYQPNELIYRYSAGSEKLAIFSEIYYPAGWKCFIDGKPGKYFRADYVLRAMVVPAGNHEIKFVFQPESYSLGNKVSLTSSLLLILMIAGYLGYSFIKKKSPSDGQPE